MMEDGDGKLELLPRKGTAILEKPRDEGSKVKRPTQSSLTCDSPSLFARSVRLPLVDLSNTLDSPICTSIPLKPSWTRINRSLFEPEDILEVFVRKKKGSHYPRKMNKVLPKKKKRFLRLKMKMQSCWWRLVASPAKGYESHLLELSGA